MISDFRFGINRKRAVVVCIALITIVFFGVATDARAKVDPLGVENLCSPAEKQALKDLKDSNKWPPACTITNPGVPLRNPGDPITFLVSGCGYHAGNPEIPCYYSVSGMVAVLINVVGFILGIVGALALLMFVWGGFQWLMSGGEEERVKSGTATLRNAVIGLLIVFGSWIAVNFIILTLTSPDQSKQVGLFEGPADNWYKVTGGAYCYRALTEKELACELAEPYKPVAPVAPAPLGTSTCPSSATKPYPNDCPCSADADCASNRCEGASIREKRCVGSGSGAAPAPAAKGVCCFVLKDGEKKIAANDMTFTECSTFLTNKMCPDGTISGAYQNFWCRRVGDPTAPGSPAPLQICWEKSGTKASEDVEKGKCGDPQSVTPNCSTGGAQ